MFSIEKMETRVARMVVVMGGLQTKITDFVTGGKTRTKFEAVGLELERQDFAWYTSLKKAIATAIYVAFGFTIRPPIKASTPVTFTASVAPPQDIPIPAGTQVTTQATSASPEKVYVTTSDAILLAGTTSISSTVVCTQPGSVGNTGPGTITVLKGTLSGISAVTNTASVVNGLDKETEDQRKTRFQKYIASLSRGTDAANEYAATTCQLFDSAGNVTEQVVDAVVVGPPFTAPSYFTLYIWNGVGTASSDLVALVQKTINGYKDSSGIRVPGYKASGDVGTVTSAVVVAADVSMHILGLEGYDLPTLKTSVETTDGIYIGSLGLSQNFSANEMIRRVKNLDGIKDLVLSSYPAGTIPTGHVYAPGTIAVTY